MLRTATSSSPAGSTMLCVMLVGRKVPHLVRVDVQHVVGHGGEVAVLLRRLEHPLQLCQLLLKGCAGVRCTPPQPGCASDPHGVLLLIGG